MTIVKKITTSGAIPARQRNLTGLADIALTSRAAPFALMLFVSLVELVLADRKYGLFTGGFGQSRAVDTPGELAMFFLGYGLVQALLGFIGWKIATALTRRGPGWRRLYIFALLNGVLFFAALAALYQLHSYFSDAVSFALLKQLGGGSLGDAILFGLSEIGLALGLAVIALGGLWLIWRLLSHTLPGTHRAPAAPHWATIASVAVTLIIAAILINRSGSDAAYGLNRMLGWQASIGLLDAASDVDRDGYGVLAIQHDSHPFDSAQHPLALDIPGNGIDEDGYGGDLTLLPPVETLPAQSFTGTTRNVVMVVMESTRGDTIGKRIDGKPVAPNLDAMVAGGEVRPAWSHVGFTTESLKSIFSGRLVPRRGDPSLFTDLAASGYRIGVFSGQPEDFGGISQTVGMLKSADVFVDAEKLRDKRAFEFAAKGSLLVDESYLLSAFDKAWSDKAAWDKPAFVYFNFQSPHFPYNHDGIKDRITDSPLDRGDIDANNADDVRKTYWNAVANADYWLGQVIARLKAAGELDNTLLLVSGDHGEDLFEGGFLGHGHIINDRQYRTFLASNQKGVIPDGPIGLDDYRSIISRWLKGEAPKAPAEPPLLHIGPLGAPTAIGLPGKNGTLTNMRLDTGEVCLVERNECAPYQRLSGEAKARADALIQRWGSERWYDSRRD